VSSADAEGRPTPLGNRSIRIASFSRLDRWKGLDTLVEAVDVVAQANPDADLALDIYGGRYFTDETYAEELIARAARGRIPVNFHGHVDDVSARMQQTDIVVVPSRTPEPFGQVIAQSISHGCVTIASNHGGAIEQVTDGINGLTFEPGNVASLASALERCIREPAQTAQLAQRASAFGEAMNDRTLANAFDAAIAQLSEEMLSA
jgi:glycosyltransferase involved in cell wall biosynthesis